MDRRGPDVLCVSLCALDVGAERGAKAFGVGLQAGPGPRLDIHTSSYSRTHTQSGPLSVPITACTEDHGHACLFLISLYLYLCSYSIENRLTFALFSQFLVKLIICDICLIICLVIQICFILTRFQFFISNNYSFI